MTTRSQIIIIAVCAGVLTLGASLFLARDTVFQYFSGVQKADIKNLKLASDSFARGDFFDASSRAKQVAANINNKKSAYYNDAAEIAALAQFTAGTRDQRIEAVRMTKQQYLDLQGNDARQAAEINILLGYMRSANQKYVFDEVFKGEPFGSLAVTGSRLASIKNIAEKSYQLYPTTEALYRIADYYRSLVHSATTSEEKQMAIDNAVATLKKTDTLYPQELAASRTSTFGYMTELRYYLWNSYIYGDLSITDPQYLSKAEALTQSMVDLYERTRDKDGNKVALIAIRLPDVYINYARYVYAVRGKARIDDIKSRLDALIQLIDEHPDWHRGSFIALVQRMASDKKNGNVSDSYKQYVELANIHPPFKAFLERYGWKFQ